MKKMKRIKPRGRRVGTLRGVKNEFMQYDSHISVPLFNIVFKQL